MLAGRLQALWPNLSQGLWFIPGLLVLVYAIAAIAMVEVDQRSELASVGVLFSGDASAARALLSVLAGSLITVAGLTFSITIVVLQLAANQFSPRVLRSFFGDRLTQLTIGSYVGIFVYAILVLRAVGSLGPQGTFVPRLSVTLASALGIGGVVLLIFFIHHISQMIQVSRITANIASQTLARAARLYPDEHGAPGDQRGEELLQSWREADEPGRVYPLRPGFVRRVGLDELAGSLEIEPTRLAILVRPGDFVTPDTALAEVWPSSATEHCAGGIRLVISLGNDRDIGQDITFGLRQLTDIGLRALSPGINDPTTAVTSISYIHAVVAYLAARSFPSPVRTFPKRDDVEVFVARHPFSDFLVPFIEIGRYAHGDAHVAATMLKALEAAARVAVDVGAQARAAEIVTVAEAVGGLAIAEAKMELDRDTIRRFLGNVRRTAAAGVASRPRASELRPPGA
ncbi:MAG: DUF2254 domain-containing protein [Chloroflexota bacterium]|nr:DUF2254 domain-containing protein [Chloroflexota bacterium]